MLGGDRARGWPSHWSYNLARTFIHLCAAITSRAEYPYSIVWPPVSSRGCQRLCWGWGVGRCLQVSYFDHCWSAQPCSVFTVHILSHCQSDKQQKASAKPVLSQCWGAVWLLVWISVSGGVDRISEQGLLTRPRGGGLSPSDRDLHSTILPPPTPPGSGSASNKTNFKFLTSFRYLSAMFVIERSQ